MAVNDDDDDFDKKPAARDLRSPDPVDNVKDNDDNDNDDDKDDEDDDDDDDDDDSDGDNDEKETPARDRKSKSHKQRPSRASCGLLWSTLKKKISLEIMNVREGQLLYNRSLALQARRNEEKKKQKKPTFTEPPTKLTDTDAYFNYLEHQSEQRHNKTAAQRTQDYDRVSSAARRSITPEKIKRLRLQKRENKKAIRAMRQVKQDKERREEEERLQNKLIETEGAGKQAQILWRKHFDPRDVDWEKRGSTVEKRRAKNLFTKLGKHFKDERDRDKRDEERELKAMPRKEMMKAQEYEADILQIDSLMYVPVSWGESDSSDNKRRQDALVGHRSRVL
jgi:hypothetical protein